MPDDETPKAEVYRQVQASRDAMRRLEDQLARMQRTLRVTLVLGVLALAAVVLGVLSHLVRH